MKLAFIIIVTLFVSKVECQTYLPPEFLTHTSPDTEYLLKKDNEERMKKVFGNMKAPKAYPVPMPKYDPTENERNQNELPIDGSSSTMLKEEISSPKKISTNRKTLISENTQTTALDAGVGQTQFIPYDESTMKCFVDGALGYDPNLTIEGNRKWYEQNGYTISYKIKDSSLLLIIAFSIFILYLTIKLISERAKSLSRFQPMDNDNKNTGNTQ